MPSKRFGPPLPAMVPERDSHVVRCYAEHLEDLGLSERETSVLTSTARHIAVWLARDGLSLDKFDIRLLDRFMRHVCCCPGQRWTGRRQLDFDDRLAMLLEREVSHRDQKSYLGHLRQAQLRIRADIQDVDCRAGRGIARTTLVQLAAGEWIRQGINLIVEGATGSGKTFIACALLAHQACRQKRPVLYRRVSELVSALARARGTRDRGRDHLGRP